MVHSVNAAQLLLGFTSILLPYFMIRHELGNVLFFKYKYLNGVLFFSFLLSLLDFSKLFTVFLRMTATC